MKKRYNWNLDLHLVVREELWNQFSLLTPTWVHEMECRLSGLYCKTQHHGLTQKSEGLPRCKTQYSLVIYISLQYIQWIYTTVYSHCLSPKMLQDVFRTPGLVQNSWVFRRKIKVLTSWTTIKIMLYENMCKV